MEITGSGINPNGYERAFLLTPTSTADLSIQKTVNKSSVKSGGLVNYMLRVANAGPDAATNVTVSDVLPGGNRVQQPRHEPGNVQGAGNGCAGDSDLQFGRAGCRRQFNHHSDREGQRSGRHRYQHRGGWLDQLRSEYGQ